jgi:chromosome segregation protein
MTYIKKLVMKGFKSFARETEIKMDQHMNVIVGPNGSGKSNVTDAMCFVLGRLSIKSIRAAKASHLIFSGNKQFKGANEASVEITLDNSDKAFALDTEEIAIRRIVRKNGQSIYKINNETKTRQEVIELLGQAGIDPHGFNIVLQGEIEKFVKMPAEERRKVIEEVAGISIYEMRKEKSLKELEKTEEKLKQINGVLRERTNYLRNLEAEREEALRFKKMQETSKKCKASILNKHVQEKEKELKLILERIDSKKKLIEKTDNNIGKMKEEMSILNEKINTISTIILKSSGLEQDSLNLEISTLKQEIAGLIARKENFENQLLELDRRRQTLQDSVKFAELEINEMAKEKGKNTKKELDEKKLKLEQMEEARRQFYLLKSNLSSALSQIEDKKRQIQSLKNESNFILSQMENIEKEIRIKEPLEKQSESLVILKSSIEKLKEQISELESSLIEKEKTRAVQFQMIEHAEKIKSQVGKLDICPLCKTKITKEHIDEVINKSNDEINSSKKLIESLERDIVGIKNSIKESKDTLAKNSLETNQRNVDIVKISTISEKKQQLKRNSEQIKLYESELLDVESKKKSFEGKIAVAKMSEEQYETLKLEVNELHRTEERNLGTEITAKQRELERTVLAIKQNLRDKEAIIGDLKDIKDSLEKKQEIVEKKDEQADELKKKYQKMYEDKNALQDKLRILESNMMERQGEKRIVESENNNLMIEKAQISAKKDSLSQELSEYPGIEFIPLTLEKLIEKLNETESTLARIGSVNMRALEVYDSIKGEYEKIREKVDQLEKEKLEILSVIETIDKKKKKTFIHTLEGINELFSRNFSQLSVKGIVKLEPQDKKEIFNAGLDITVNVGGGKYFDVTSLSGGEQTLVALSLIFSIQEFKPYCFYIFDEIDAALDRRNSEKLAYLLKKYMKHGQYLIITHNDSIISESSNILYGVSMQEGISKVLSLEI